MKVLLLKLSGVSSSAIRVLNERYPDAEIIELRRAELQNGSLLDRLRAVRDQRPDVFAVSTESIGWQHGIEAMMLLGAIAWARESIVIDTRGGQLFRTRLELFGRAPFEIMRSAARGKAAVRNARKTLDRLERSAAAENVNQTRQSTNHGNNISITYLRSTPAAIEPGGATSHVKGVIKALTQLGARVTIISNDEMPGLDVDVTLIAPERDVTPRSAFDIHNSARFAAESSDLIAASPPDAIYQRYSRFSWAGVEASLRTGVPLFLEYNGSEVWIGKNWDGTRELDLLERCERLNLAVAHRVFVVSEIEKQNLVNAGVPHAKIVVNPNGADPDEFRPGSGGKEERELLGIAPDATLVGFVGTFGPWHGVLALADAIALTPNPDIHFLMVGDGSLRPNVEEKLMRSGSLGRVTFTGAVGHERVPALLDACDILVSPHVPFADGSAFFGSPTKLFEYMAAGKAIVASRIGQIADVLSDNETALLVEPGNADELSSAFERLASDRGLIERLGSAARERAIEHHTWQNNARRILDELKR